MMLLLLLCEMLRAVVRDMLPREGGYDRCFRELDPEVVTSMVRIVMVLVPLPMLLL